MAKNGKKGCSSTSSLNRGRSCFHDENVLGVSLLFLDVLVKQLEILTTAPATAVGCRVGLDTSYGTDDNVTSLPAKYRVAKHFTFLAHPTDEHLLHHAQTSLLYSCHRYQHFQLV